VMPRYIFFFRRLDQQAAAPIAIPKAIATAAAPSLASTKPIAAVEDRFRRQDDTKHTHAGLTIVWVDANHGEANGVLAKQLRDGVEAEKREVLCMTSTDELKVWLRTHWSCIKKRKGKVRVITNRTRERDGGQQAAEQLIHWLRSSSKADGWNEIKCLVYCGAQSVAQLQHVRVNKLTFVTSDAALLKRFCESDVDWSKLQ
jgi:hypothetical protein